IVNGVDATTPGSYTVTYNVDDAAGNKAVEIVRTVTVVDTTDPVITLVDGPAISVEVGVSNTIAPVIITEGVGEKIWEFETGHFMYHPPAIGLDGTTVYLGAMDGNLYALDVGTGTKKWEFPAGAAEFGPAVIGSDGTVFVGTNKVYALDGQTGAKKWEFAAGLYVSSTLALGADDTLYVTSEDKKVYALDGQAGTKKWEFDSGATVHSPVVGVDGIVYVQSDKFYALDGATGAKLWEFETGPLVWTTPVIRADGSVYVGSNDKKLYALDGRTGDINWEFATPDAVKTLVIGADATIYIVAKDKKIYALDGQTGATKWESVVEVDEWASPAIGSDGTIYIGSDGAFDSSKLYALNGQTGAKSWEFGVGGGAISPTLGADGAVYIVSSDKKLYSIQGSSGPADSPWSMLGQNAQHTGRAKDISNEVVFTDPGSSATDTVDGNISDKIVATGEVGIEKVGEYTLTYEVSDTAGNSTTITRVVTVVDTAIPVITLKGDAETIHEGGADYVDAGVDISDNYDTDLEAVVVNPVDKTKPGEYTISYNVSDSSGNAAVEVTRKVTVVDTTGPIITLVGDAEVTHEGGAAYTDAGVTIADNIDEGLESTVVNPVDANVPGEYTVTYNVADAVGNAAVEATRKVTVVDTTAPVITLKGEADITIEVKSDYTDGGADIADAVDTEIATRLVVINGVDNQKLGDYAVT
ncbi:MAG: DUF5011 domain-containing protein, partial [Opitutae bacterium]|nr:DUF5011 domain-containing protein [Opitutae bacterium]